MDARRILLTILALSALCTSGTAQVFMGPGSVAQTANFRVYARSAQLAHEIANSAEASRKQLAMHWIGKELPNWPERCPIAVNDGPNKPASGETKYSLVPGGVANFTMSLSGTIERIIDSVLPHEMTHTVIASHLAALGKPVPRWADEGACTTVEHLSERSKHDVMLVRYLSEGRGIAFKTLFELENYPPDMMPLYAQGYSLSCFLISQGGPRHFVQFLERGMNTNNWAMATEEFYQYPKLGKLQSAWNRWVSDGGGVVDNYKADALGISALAKASNPQNNIALINAVRSNPVPVSSPSSPTLNMLNKSMEASSGSFYVDQFRSHQQTATQSGMSSASDTFVPARTAALSDPNAMQQILSLPSPPQTIGGSSVRR